MNHSLFFYATALLWVPSILLPTILLAQPAIVQVEDPRHLEVSSLETYLPDGVSYDANVPTPKSSLGWEVGEFHVRHDQLAAYMHEVAQSSDRVHIQETGRTHEKRPQLLLTISSPENLARLEQIRTEHLKLSDPRQDRPDTTDMPVVVYLGYSIHGNEPSGSNASLLVAYYLAAGNSPEIDNLLNNTIVLLDPSLNPDGLGRFAHWANTHRGQVLVADPDHREHREAWPSGRTNHYWFDLNRDWLPAQHPESQNRLRQFHAWRPNVLCDFHEMGTNSTYFFQPGVPTRNNPLTPKRNFELTQELAKFHARALDQIGSLYYTEEQFDDFYYGKGSTYPDVNGAIGILFEQASSRGHLQESLDGVMSFPFTIRNQFLTSLSTLEGALANRQTLLDYQADFYREKAPASIGGWVFGSSDRARLHHFLELLDRHQIEVHELKNSIEAGGRTFTPGSAYVAPSDQPQQRLLRAMFERRTEFEDSTFYDVSTWTLPLAFNLDHALLDDVSTARRLAGARVDTLAPPTGQLLAVNGPAYAYLMPWNAFYAPRALYELLDAGIRARVATVPLTVEVDGQTQTWAAGTILIPRGLQAHTSEDLERLLQQIAERHAVDIQAVAGGLTSEGVDLGSPTLERLTLPRPALLVDSPASTYEAGEIWHLLDHRFQIPLTLLTFDRLTRADLDRYTHLILVNGNYDRLRKTQVDALHDFVRGGGVLITTKDAVRFADEHIFPGKSDRKDADRDTKKRSHGGDTNVTHTQIATGNGDDAKAPSRRPYTSHEPDRAVHLISGAIFEVDLDRTHPLAFGYDSERLAVFRNSQLFLGAEPDPYAIVAQYTSSPLMSGYISPKNLSKLRETPALTAHRVGAGTVVRMVDNPTFRAFWYGTQKLFLNAIFFGDLIEDTTP